ncbi:MAG TPA: tetratricopeptide repeat protein [Campylobacterales bacterium]|nr:tetratricopeptide repeat protein [Campylobacterales bacterium]
MTLFQFLLFVVTVAVFIMFFKQLFSGNLPTNKIDIKPNRDELDVLKETQLDKQIISGMPRVPRVQQLVLMANQAIEQQDFVEADKALSSALILEKDNIELLLQHGFVLLSLKRLEDAKETYLEVLKLNENEDMAHASLANVCHHLNENELALKHHRKSIEIDENYAPHYFNYANTLYDLSQRDQALIYYKKAYELDPSIEEAIRMIKELS